MATRTASTATRGAQPLAIEKGLNTKVIKYNSGSDSFDASATTVLLAKIPQGATIVDVHGYHSTGSATAPMDVGIGSSVSAFISAGAQGLINRASKGVIDYTVSVSADAAVQYEFLKATVTLASATTSVKISVSVNYLADGQ